MKQATILGLAFVVSMFVLGNDAYAQATPVVTSTYDLVANPASRLITAVGGTNHIAISFAASGPGMLMMTAGTPDYKRPDRVEVNISKTPGSFVPIQASCNQVDELGQNISLQWVTKLSDQPAFGPVCLLEPDKRYYLNIRHTDATGRVTACNGAERCGMYIDNPPSGTTVTPDAPGTSGVASCTALPADLELGDEDENVRKLQQYLNSAGFAVSMSGAGSSGYETMFFGKKTKSAVIGFQARYGIRQTGVAGPLTRAKIQELSCGGSVAGGTTARAVALNTPAPKSVVQEAPPAPSTGLVITSPKGGETLTNRGCPPPSTTQTETCTPRPIAEIFWSYSDSAAKITIEVHHSTRGRVRTLATRIGNSGQFTWPYTATLADGNYKIVIKATNRSGTQLAIAETGYFEVLKDEDPNVRDIDGPAIACPPVPSKTRTYTKTYPGMSFYCTAENGGCVDQVTLKHYRYPEKFEAEQFLSVMERCALTATPGSRTCPYTYSNYPNSVDVNKFSILTREPDPLNDPNEIGDRRMHAYLKPIIGFSHANDAFDFSIPFSIKSSEEGKTFDFHYTVENQTLQNAGQFSISECEGDYSERAVWTSPVEDIWGIRTYILATDGLEGAKFIVNTAGTSLGTPVLALKAGKTYYLNIRWLKHFQAGSYSGARCFRDASGNCTSPFVHTDSLPDSAIHDHALWRQLAADPSANYVEFYRWHIDQYGFQSPIKEWMNESVLSVDPLFDRPGGIVLNPYLYYPSCNAGGLVHNGIRGSDCKIVCNEGYVVDQAKGWCVKQ